MEFRGLFSVASKVKQGTVRPMITMKHGSTILARSKHGRLRGGCSPGVLYHTHWGKSIDYVHPGRVMAQTCHKHKLYSSCSIRKQGILLKHDTR